MATVTDVEVANASFPTVRQDLNDILEAIATNFSADAEPTTTYPNQWWYETDTNKLYIRNEDNDAWIHVLTLDQTTDTVSSVQGVSADAISEGNSSVEVIDSGTGYVQINVDGAEVARLDATGLGVGVTSPTATLDVNGTIKLDGNHPVGTGNVALGDQALNANTTGIQNTAVGSNAGATATAGYVTAFGYNAATAASSSYSTIVAIGAGALQANTTGIDNLAIGGYNTLGVNTTGSYNIAVGREALNANTTTSNNTAVGYRSLYSNTAHNNTAVGYNSLYLNTTGTNGVAIGAYALDANTAGSNNIAVGRDALGANTTGGDSVCVGYQAGYSGTTAGSNTFIGNYAGYSTTSGNNTYIGRNSGDQMTTGSSNTILGRFNGNQSGLDIRTSSNNIVLSDGDGNVRAYANSGTGWLIGTTNNSPAESSTATGMRLGYSGGLQVSKAGTEVAVFNRNTNDGVIMEFRQAGTLEGTISVSGTTVSYNGGHLSRWSQLADNTRDESIVKGTVMSNLDQMAEWITDGVTEDNEQLNCIKVSDVEGDANVAGVFVNWDDDDDVYTNDMNVAMTGDMVIRIAQGTTVARGDLLMSAGDGTAKPQGDDIVRSKTIAKVTSTHVSHTYDDGSYLVPCVLMAC